MFRGGNLLISLAELPRYRLGPRLSGQSADVEGISVKISEDAKGCVVFFGLPAENDSIRYGGTGFLVRVKDGELGFGYLVTCRHVAKFL